MRLQPGSTVFVSGTLGFIGSATVEDLVKRGYKVRGATRDLKKGKPFLDKIEQLAGKDALELLEIPDFTSPGAYAQALKDVDGVVHIATDMSFSTDFEQVIRNATDASVNILKEAAKIPSIKSFVLTSSCLAVYLPQSGSEQTYSLDQYADHLLPILKTLPANDPRVPALGYAASKVASERAAWAWYAENKPGFVLNTVLPFLVDGPIANPAPGAYSTASALQAMFRGQPEFALSLMTPPGKIVDVRDVAVLHSAALLSEKVQGQRLWGGGHAFEANQVLEIWREAFPKEKNIPASLDVPAASIQNIDNGLSAELLRDFADRDWIPLKQSLIETVAVIAEV